MRSRLLVIGLILGALALPSAALGTYVEHPTIHERQAEEDAQHFLAKKYSGWRKRSAGYIDCRHGRINGYTWSCGGMARRAELLAGTHPHRKRIPRRQRHLLQRQLPSPPLLRGP